MLNSTSLYPHRCHIVFPHSNTFLDLYFTHKSVTFESERHEQYNVDQTSSLLTIGDITNQIQDKYCGPVSQLEKRQGWQ